MITVLAKQTERMVNWELDHLIHQSTSCWKEVIVHLWALLSSSKLNNLMADLIGKAFSLVGGEEGGGREKLC